LDAERLIWAIVAVALGVGIGASFGSGRTLLLQFAAYPRIVQRRKEPFEFWAMVVFQAALAAMSVGAAVKISN
jgi:hypothetical protein